MYFKQSVVNVRPKSTLHKNDYCPHRALPIFSCSSLGSMMEKVSSDLIHKPINRVIVLKRDGISAKRNPSSRLVPHKSCSQSH